MSKHFNLLFYKGHGTFKYADNSKYIGQYVDGEKEGKGVMTYSDGKRYEGTFKNKK